MQPVDWNQLIKHLFETMPLWLPMVAVALKLNVPGFTAERKDK